MGNPLHNELKKEFQLERLILFSDAVFAIAITLLAIEIKIPEVHEGELTDHNLLIALAHLIPKFIGFFVSFLLVGQYWVVHHRMFSFVVNYNTKLIWLNLFFLLFVALMPFSTGFYSEYARAKLMTPIVFYTGNIALLGIVNFMMWRYIAKPSRNLTENFTPTIAKYFSFRAIMVPVIFIIFCFVFMWEPRIAFWIPMTIPVWLRVFFRPLRKKIEEEKRGVDFLNEHGM